MAFEFSPDNKDYMIKVSDLYKPFLSNDYDNNEEMEDKDWQEGAYYINVEYAAIPLTILKADKYQDRTLTFNYKQG